MLKEEKEKIKDYFVSFNMVEEDSCLCLRIPDKWVMPDDIDKSIYINEEKKKDGIYFLCTDSDPSILFNTANHIIKINKVIEEKRKLFSEAIRELETFFENRDVKDLYRLKFVIDDIEKKDVKKEKANIKEVEQPKEQPEARDMIATKKENKKESSMMAEAKKMVCE